MQKEQAIALWQEAFHDTEKYIRFFLNQHGDATVLTKCCDNHLVSALYLIDGAIRNGSETAKAYYLFAAATFLRERRQGHMERLLKKAEDYAKSHQAQYLALVPASPTLFSYYAKFGFRTAFYAKEADINLSCSSLPPNQASFVWTQAHLQYIRREAQEFSLPLLEKDGMLFSVHQNTILVPDSKQEHPYGMLLPLNESARKKAPQNAYIGLTME